MFRICSTNSASAAAPTSSSSPSSAAPLPPFSFFTDFCFPSFRTEQAGAFCFRFLPRNRSALKREIPLVLSIRNPKPHNAPQCFHSILPRNLFPLFVRPPRIADRYFVHAPILLRNFRRY